MGLGFDGFVFGVWVGVEGRGVEGRGEVGLHFPRSKKCTSNSFIIQESNISIRSARIVQDLKNKLEKL